MFCLHVNTQRAEALIRAIKEAGNAAKTPQEWSEYLGGPGISEIFVRNIQVDVMHEAIEIVKAYDQIIDPRPSGKEIVAALLLRAEQLKS
jgi:hypothetical protein